MGNENGESKSALDKFVAPGLRVWMVIGLIGCVMLVMIVIVCCFCKIRIPRTKRQIEVIATRRKMRKQQQGGALNGGGMNGQDLYEDRRAQTIVMNSLASRPAKSDRMQTAGGNERRRETLNSHSVNV